MQLAQRATSLWCSMRTSMHIIFLITLVLMASSASAGWMDDWMDNATNVSTNAGVYESQSRKWATGGNFSMRWPVGPTQPLVNFQAPRLKSGCGGVDIFWGGISFLKIDYLVDKFQSFIVNAAAVAFHLGLNMLCTPCSVISNTLESMESFLNSLQQDSCMAAMATVHSGAEKYFPEAYARAQVETSSSLFGYKHFEELWSNDKKPTTAKTADTQASCSSDWMLMAFGQTAFPAAGGTASLLDNIATNFGMPGDVSSAVAAIRGLAGDVRIVVDPTDGMKIYTHRPCAANENMTMQHLVSGDVQPMNDSGDCVATSQFATTSIATIIETHLDSIMVKMESKVALTAEEKTFVANAPLPLIPLLQFLSLGDLYQGYRPKVVAYLANRYALAFFGDTSARLNKMLYKVREITAMKQGAVESAADPSSCTAWYKEDLEDGLSTLLQRVRDLQEGLTDQAVLAERQWHGVLAAEAEYQNRRANILSALGETFSKSIGVRVGASL